MRAAPTFAVLAILGIIGDVGAAERPSQLVRPLPQRSSAQRPDSQRPPDVQRAEAGEAGTKTELEAEGMCTSRSSGGPDPFGYSFIDSTEPGGPAFDWVELSGAGTQVLLADDDYAGPFDVGFPFTFYGENVATFFIQSNGAVTFSNQYLTNSNRCPIPYLTLTRELIALMWDDLDPGSTNDPVWFSGFGAGACPYDGYGGACLAVEYEHFHHWAGGLAGTFELILFDDHSLVMQFLDVGDETGAGSTTGIQSRDGQFGLTYACNAAGSLTEGIAVRFQLTPQAPVEIRSIPAEGRICPGTFARYDMVVVNNTGTTTAFDILYSGFDWSVSGEAAVAPLTQGGAATFPVIHRPPVGAPAGASDAGTVTARVQGSTASATTDLTTRLTPYVVESLQHAPHPRMDGAVVTPWTAYSVFAVGGWDDGSPPGTPPVLPGIPSLPNASREATVNSFSRSTGSWDVGSSDWNAIPFSGDMAWGRNVSGEAVAIGFPDATGFSDLMLHIYNFSHDVWQRAPLPTGFPPIGIWGHDIACDSATNRCYITGGGSSPGGGDLTTVYAYDVAANTVTPLPPFTSPRAHHASFLIDGMLCVAGGIDATETPLASTQCYDVSASTWHPENGDLGSLPGTLWGMADAVMAIEGELRPVMAGGILDGGPPGKHFLWYDGTTWQADTPFDVGLYRTEADVADNVLYLAGGSTSGLTPSSAFQTLRWCATAPPSYDDCSSALALDFGGWADVTNELASDSGPPLPSCADYQGGDVWLQVTVPADAFVPCFVVSPVPTSGVTDIGLSYYAECPHVTEIECGSTNIGSGILYPQLPGTYWLRVWEIGNDTFGAFAVGAFDCWIPVELMSFTIE